jgi:hypothetical protein
MTSYVALNSKIIICALLQFKKLLTYLNKVVLDNYAFLLFYEKAAIGAHGEDIFYRKNTYKNQ